MKKFIFLIMMVAPLLGAAQTTNFQTQKFAAVTADSTVVRCQGYDKLAFVAFGNAGEYALVTLYSNTAQSLGTVRVAVGYPYNVIAEDLKTNGNAVVNMGTLSNWTSGGAEQPPAVYCYCQRY